MDHSIDNNSMLFLIVLTNAEGNSDVIPKIDGRQSELKDAKEFFTRLKTKYPGRLEIEYLDSTPRNQIKSEVERIYKSWKEKFKVQPCYGIHYFGHAMMRDQIGWLVAKDPETGRPGWIEDKKFATNFSEVLMEVKQPSMVCFQACDSAKIGTVSNQLRGVAYEFTKLNIPAVIGMQNEVQPTSSSVFFENFYDQVLQGKDVGEAVTFGRDYLGRVFGVDGEPYRNNSFGSPVLFITTAEPITIISNEEQAPEESSTEPVEKNVPLSKSLARVEENKSEEPERANANAQSDAVSKPINNPALKVVHDAHS